MLQRDTDRHVAGERKKAMRIRETIVVEGRDDTAAVRAAVDAVTIETHGYGIREEIWEVLERAYESTGLIVFTDPDSAGERIRRRLTDRFPKAMQAFLDQAEAAKDGDIGIENASPEAIRRALQRARGPVDFSTVSGGEDAHTMTAPGGAGTDSVPASGDAEPITIKDMDRWGLNGTPGAAQQRRALGQELGIGTASCKTFLRRLNHFGISREEVEATLSGSVPWQ